MAEEGRGQEKWACGVAGGQKTARELYSLAGSRGCITDIRNTLARERGTGITAKLGGALLCGPRMLVGAVAAEPGLLTATGWWLPEVSEAGGLHSS